MVLIIQHHMRPGHLVQLPTLTRKALHRLFRDLAEEGISTLLLALADRYATLGPKVFPHDLHRDYHIIKFMINKFYSPTPPLMPPKIVKGDEIMAHFGLKSGPLRGKLLREVEEAFVDKKVKNKEETLTYIASLLNNSSSSHF